MAPKSDYENARSRTAFTPQPRKRQYVVCTKCHVGWEWVSNHKTFCREPDCGGKLAVPHRSSSPRRRSNRSQGSKQSSRSAASSIPPELLPLLADKLPELEKLCPEIAKSVKGFVSPAPAAPAAALHGAQSTCQIAFKDLQAAETQVSEFESEASELVAELRRKISQLITAQLELTSARAKYEEAATAVQLEVK